MKTNYKMFAQFLFTISNSYCSHGNAGVSSDHISFLLGPGKYSNAINKKEDNSNYPCECVQKRAEP